MSDPSPEMLVNPFLCRVPLLLHQIYPASIQVPIEHRELLFTEFVPPRICAHVFTCDCCFFLVGVSGLPLETAVLVRGQWIVGHKGITEPNHINLIGAVRVSHTFRTHSQLRINMNFSAIILFSISKCM